MSWLGLLGLLGWLVDPVSKGFTEIGKLAADLGASASAQAQADATVKIRRIEARISEAQNAKEIRLATANFLEMRLLTVAVAVPFVAHTWAVYGWQCFATGMRRRPQARHGLLCERPLPAVNAGRIPGQMGGVKAGQ